MERVQQVTFIRPRGSNFGMSENDKNEIKRRMIAARKVLENGSVITKRFCYNKSKRAKKEGIFMIPVKTVLDTTKDSSAMEGMHAAENEELKGILTELTDMLREVYRDKMKAVILYGSVARGTAMDDSDVDIMVLVDGTNQELRMFEDRLNDVSTDISIKYYKVFSIIDVSYQEYIAWEKVSPFYRNISEEGVVLYAA